MNKGKRRSLSKLNAVVRRAAAPLSPRRSPMVLSPMSTSNMLSPIFDYERIGRAFSRKRRKQAEAARALAPGGDATTGADGTTLGAMDEAKELGRAQERARGLDAVLSESLANVPEGTSAGVAKPAVASGETVANATANKENVKSKRPDPRTKQRAKIVPPPVFNGWERSSMDRMMVAGGGSGSSEVASLASSKGAVRPVSILASGPSTVVKAVGGNQTPLEGAATNATRPKPKIKIKTTSLPLEVPTRPVTPIGGTASTSVVQNAHVTFTPQTYTPQSSRRDSVVVAVAQQQGSRRDSVVVQHPGMGGRRESGHGGPAMVGMSQVLEEAFAKHAERKKGDTQLTDRTDRTDRTWPASDVSDDSGVFWLVDEPEEMDEEDAGEESRGGGVKSGGPSRMASFGATSSIAVTTTMTAHALNSAAAAAGSPVRALSVSKGKTSEGEKGKKTKRLFGRHPRRCMSPEALFCDGWCWKRYEKEGVDGKTHMPFVISLSAAKDGQQAWEDASGASMTQHLVKILREDPTPTMGTLLGQISHDLHTTYLDIHSRARDYRKKAREVNKVRMLKGKQMKDVMAVEMNNFQDPQVSSLWPLDMKREVWDP
ncbi:hypothetical protein BKA70DRAFT_1280117 [Coprinopsis sp. MPI-PUGE-AT-0042]|nr:hypothetical protein BKA70DRAFT_1280117 [Coprinopsis sp. MPI-PUGE-AT-0042]